MFFFLFRSFWIFIALRYLPKPENHHHDSEQMTRTQTKSEWHFVDFHSKRLNVVKIKKDYVIHLRIEYSNESFSSHCKKKKKKQKWNVE